MFWEGSGWLTGGVGLSGLRGGGEKEGDKLTGDESPARTLGCARERLGSIRSTSASLPVPAASQEVAGRRRHGPLGGAVPWCSLAADPIGDSGDDSLGKRLGKVKGIEWGSMVGFAWPGGYRGGRNLSATRRRSWWPETGKTSSRCSVSSSGLQLRGR